MEILNFIIQSNSLQKKNKYKSWTKTYNPQKASRVTSTHTVINNNQKLYFVKYTNKNKWRKLQRKLVLLQKQLPDKEIFQQTGKNKVLNMLNKLEIRGVAIKQRD